MANDVSTDIRPNRRTRRWSVVAMIVAILVALAACSSDKTTTTATDTGASASANKDPYKIAYLGPLSGTLGGLGSTQLKAITSVVDLVNSKGGVNGHKIELLSEDDANDPAKAIAAARSLIDKGVIGIVGPPVSSIVEAVLPTTSRAGVPIITVGATPAALNPAQPTLFQVDQTSASQAQPMVEFAEALLKKSDFKAQVGPIDTPSGLAWGENVKKLSEKKGFDILGTTPIPTAPGDVTTFAQKLVEGNPEIVLVEMTDVPFVTMVQKLRDLGYKGPIVNFHGGGSATVFNTLKDPDVYSARTYNHYDETNTSEGMQDYVAAAQKAGTVETAKSASLYGSVYIAGLAMLGGIEQCGDSCTPETLTKALNSLNLDTKGLTPGPLVYTETNHQTANTDVFWHWDGAKPAPALDGKVFKGSVYSLEDR